MVHGDVLAGFQEMVAIMHGNCPCGVHGLVATMHGDHLHNSKGMNTNMQAHDLNIFSQTVLQPCLGITFALPEATTLHACM